MVKGKIHIVVYGIGVALVAPLLSPLIIALLPCIEGNGLLRVVAVPCLGIAAADFTEHIEERITSIGSRVEHLLIVHHIQRKSRNMTNRINTESVNAHIDIL